MSVEQTELLVVVACAVVTLVNLFWILKKFNATSKELQDLRQRYMASNDLRSSAEWEASMFRAKLERIRQECEE